MNEKLEIITLKLFKWNYYDDSEYTDEVDNECRDIVETTIEQFGWQDVWKSWYRYLIQKCRSAKEVCNFAHLFFGYSGTKYPIDNPYEFLGYIYYYLGLNSSKYEDEYNALTIMDSITIDTLEKAGVKKDLWLDDNYVPEKDPLIIQSVEDWKNRIENTSV